VELIGVYIGVQSVLFWMHKNDFAKFLTANVPDFLIKEIAWLFIISFSITLFNMMPIPGFDGDRISKEIIKWIFGEKYGKTERKKKNRFYYKGDDTDCHLPEYHVINVESIKIYLKEKENSKKFSEIVLSKDNYELIDKVGDGYFDTVSIVLPEDTTIEDDTAFEITYEYLLDENIRKKKLILNLIRLISLSLIIGNFALSFIKFGFNFFWI